MLGRSEMAWPQAKPCLQLAYGRRTAGVWYLSFMFASLAKSRSTRELWRPAAEETQAMAGSHAVVGRGTQRWPAIKRFAPTCA